MVIKKLKKGINEEKRNVRKSAHRSHTWVGGKGHQRTSVGDVKITNNSHVKSGCF